MMIGIHFLRRMISGLKRLCRNSPRKIISSQIAGKITMIKIRISNGTLKNADIRPELTSPTSVGNSTVIISVATVIRIMDAIQRITVPAV